MPDISSLGDAADDVRSDMDMIRERFPELGPRIDAHMAKIADEMMAAFQPIVDLAEGKITHEEFCTIVEQQHAADLEKRRQHWAWAFDTKTETWTVQCEDCSNNIVYEDEPPPLYPQCEGCELAEEEELAEEDDG